VLAISLGTGACTKANPQHGGTGGTDGSSTGAATTTSTTDPSTSGEDTSSSSSTSTDPGTEGTGSSGDGSSTGEDVVIDACGGVNTVLCHGIMPVMLQLDGQSPGPIAAGPIRADADDFDDLAIAFTTSHEVQLVLGNGTVFMQRQAPVPLGNGPPFDLQLADLDAGVDADLEILTANQAGGSSNFSVVDNLGNGVLSEGVLYGSGNRFHALAVADFTGDDVLDVAVAVRETNSAHVYQGEGLTFAMPPIFTATLAQERPEGIAAGDLDGDGHLDLAFAHERNHVTVLLGDGAGDFVQAAEVLGFDERYRHVRIADLDDDGALDILACNNASEVHVLYGDGTGAFTEPQILVAGTTARWIAVGDVNNDGHVDFAVANRGGGSISVFAGDGQREFVRVNLSLGANPSAVAFAYLNDDTVLDIAVTIPSANQLALFMSNPVSG
jgi:hypothetical protein